MIKSIVRGSAVVALVAGSLVLSRMPATAGGGDTPNKPAETAVQAGGASGAIVRTFSKERLLELKVERVCCDKDKNADKKASDETPAKNADAKTDGNTDQAKTDKKCDLRAGQVIFVDVTNARVFDEKGAEKLRDDKSAWFVKDAGWSVLKTGQRVKVSYSGTKEIQPPTSFPSDTRGTLLVYVASQVELMAEVNPEMAYSSHEIGSTEGTIVRLFSKEKLIEFKVSTAVRQGGDDVTAPNADAPKSDANKDANKDTNADKNKATMPRAGEVIFLHVPDAIVFDETGKERLRDDKAAWFTKDDGWSILKAGHKLSVDFTGTHQVLAPKDFPADARSGGNILVYHASVIRSLETK